MVAIKNILQRLYPFGLFRKGKAVYLTFDDGPIPEITPKVLAILRHYGVKATFFMVGENIAKHPEVFKLVLKEGHAIGNHTYNHLKGWRYSLKEYIANITKSQEIIERYGGQTNLFRPPYGKTWVWQRHALTKAGYTICMWDILTRDYDPHRKPAEMLTQIMEETRHGSIINFHDSLKSNERMLAVLPKAIEWLLQNGYELRTLNE